ncbi:RNase P modulator RnpM [Fervidibacillus halotolerans]|uniref:YlxR family protein n=1 Tax=Fervidibacillus halotolerans TaxID=2980027 RepID=A0A9E8M1P6_9BACI|nr:YlxR family protein [Fervidibacillus halotolerans]WAA13566.1 YlxR family protein [Fervidibacillus halotolerans]
MTRQKKIPMRKCVATGEMLPKKELIRIVRSKDGEVSIDPTGKKSGRGAYLSKNKDAVVLAKKKNILEKHLKVEVDEKIYEEITQYIEKEPTS